MQEDRAAATDRPPLQFVPSTVLAVLSILLLLGLGLHRGLWAFMALAPFGAAAAFNLPALGGATIGVLDLAAVAIFCMVLLTRGTAGSLLGSFRPFGPGFWFALVMVVSFIATMFFPRLFAGETSVFLIARIEGMTRILQFPLQPTTGNITQLFRLMLGFLTFAALATSFRRTSTVQPVLTALAVATAINFALGWLDVLTFQLGMTDLMSWLRSANYAMHITDRMVGMKRMIGGFPEASSFGYFTLGLFGFWMQFWLLRPENRLGRWMLALSTISVLRSTSSSAYIALVVFLGLFALYTIFANLRPETSRRAFMLAAGGILTAWVATVAVFASYEYVQPVTDFLDRALFTKLDSQSGVERMGWNAQALQNAWDTYGLGAGLGSVRASNWVIACLASIGVPGTVLFLAFMASLGLAPSRPLSDPRAIVVRALKAGCLAMLCAAVLTHSTPDMGVFFFALAGLLTGLSRALGIESTAARAG
ncbi:hypothetical protein [uncultured Maritimibacter sp.]|uniref:hypothetical protein n=1 Tax=uncultured Maritimibacter sp. TaxID=991866 RepID=UPI0030DA7C03